MCRALAPALLIVLAACAPTRDQHGLSDLLLEETDGSLTPYLDAIEGVPPGGKAAGPLPLARVWVGALGAESRWLAAFDFDRNDILDRTEMAQAWLIQAARLSTGRAYSPDGLRARTAADVPLRGVALLNRDQRVVRAVLEATEAGVALLVAAEDVIDRVTGGGDDESMEDDK